MTTRMTMREKMLHLFVFIGILEGVKCDTRVTVVDSACGRTYSPADGDLYLTYHGDTLNECTFYLKTHDSSKMVCAYIEKMDIGSCLTTIQFYIYTYIKRSQRTERGNYQTFTCTSERITEYCQPLVTELNLDFIHDGNNTSDEVKIRITYEKDNTILYVIIPFVAVAVAVILGIVIVVVRKRLKAERESDTEEPAVGVFTTFRS